MTKGFRLVKGEVFATDCTVITEYEVQGLAQGCECIILKDEAKRGFDIYYKTPTEEGEAYGSLATCKTLAKLFWENHAEVGR